ncbi:MAG: dolichol-phosphate mannosyltransferase [Candidatus Peregrinibacteria bacterium Greene0416_19]|nr:MAG: dolichol-phosphate mannosyltransferase [Candidatus Peregrinibacteria bacterium Greene0416_19]
MQRSWTEADDSSATLLRVLSLILPTFNEAQNLPELLPKVQQALGSVPYEIIIVDDDSPDRTWEVAREMGKADPGIRVIRRVGRWGLSSAVIEGFLTATGDMFVVMDADGQHDPSIVTKLMQALEEGAGIAIGSRYVEGGGVVGEWDERRAMLSRIATRLAIRLCRVKVKDPMSGFFAIRRDVFEDALPRLNPKGFKILLDLLIHIRPHTRVWEIPFTFGVRAHGESKLSRRVQIEFIEYLYEAVLGRFLPLTFVQYCIVGAMGVAVHLAAYALMGWMLTGDLTPTPAQDSRAFLLAMLGGIEAAIVFNFILNNAWTFARARLRGWRAILGFLRFNAACAFGALASYSVTLFLFALGFGFVSVFVGALVGVIWNYTMNRVFTWRDR